MRARTKGPPGQVRIIGGKWKRTPLAVSEAPGLRPTPDRVRETLFNWLGQSLEGWHCLDLFAGTGALGLEAASRGASRVVLVERDRQNCQVLREAIERLKAHDTVELVEADAALSLSRLAQTAPASFDLVFLDPPFSQGWIARLFGLLEPVLTDHARLYVESEAPVSDLPQPWRVERAGRAGQVHYHLLSRGAGAAPDH
mgnify:CR=1 FL=1